MNSRADFCVSAEGNDGWTGRLADPAPGGTDGPFATPVRARDGIRAMRTADGDRDYEVFFRDGRYYLDETVVFGLEDGTDGTHAITYAAYPGEKPVFSSGAPITGWQELEERPEGLPELTKAKVWVADVPAGLARFRSLYDGDTRLQRAR